MVKRGKAMAIVVTPVATLYSGYSILATSDQGLEVHNPYNRTIPFKMVIDSAFTVGVNDTAPLAFSDVTGYTTYYRIVDRLNKPVTGYELYRYVGKRRCVDCVYSPIYKTVKICSCIDPIALEIPTETTAPVTP